VGGVNPRLINLQRENFICIANIEIYIQMKIEFGVLGEIYQKSYRFRPFYVVLGRNLLKTGWISPET